MIAASAQTAVTPTARGLVATRVHLAVWIGSLALHAATMLWFAQTKSEPTFRSEPATADAAVVIEKTCYGEAILGTGAESLLCVTPWAEADCATWLVKQHQKALEACDVAKATEVALIEVPPTFEPRQREALASQVPPEQKAPPKPIPEPQKPIQLSLLTAPPAAKPAEQKPPEPKPEEKPAEQKPPEPKPEDKPPSQPAARPLDSQIVEVVKPLEEKAPEKTRLLSEYDSSVEKQTVARGTLQKMVEKPSAEKLPDDERVKATNTDVSKAGQDSPNSQANDDSQENSDPGKRGGPNVAISQLFAMRGSTGKKPEPLSTPLPLGKGEPLATTTKPEPIKKPLSGSEGVAQKPLGPSGNPNPEIGTGGKTDSGLGQGGLKKPRLLLQPDSQTLEKIAGGGSVDALEDVAEDEVTRLNSRKEKHAGFFNRLKRQVAQNWHPADVYVRKDPHGNIYGFRDRLTVVRVTLDKTGMVDNVYIVKQSGIAFLDEEALRAFRRAEMFVNPPAGLVDAEGHISFNFGFQFQVDGGSGSWKLFRAD